MDQVEADAREIESVPDPLPVPASSSTVTSTVWLLGKRKTFAGLLLVEWVFLCVSVLNILLTVGLTVFRLVHVIQHDPQSPDFTLTILILINAGFCLFYVIHGLLKEREHEVYVFIGAIVVVLLYCIIEYAVNYSAGKDNTIKLVRMVIACLLAPIDIALAAIVARNFGWLEFKIVGASKALQDMYREASRFLDLLKFDFQLAASFVLLVLKNGVEVDTFETVTLAVGLCFVAFGLIFGWLILTKEWRWATGAFILQGLVEPAYIIYKLVMIYKILPAKEVLDLVLVYSTIVVAFLALCIRGILLVEMVRVHRNFGQGLKEKAFSSDTDETTSLLAAAKRRR